MRARPFVWFLLSLLCFAGAWWWWQQGERWAAEKRSAAPGAVSAASAAPKISTAVSPNAAKAGALANTNQFAWRLSNTPKSIGQLVNDGHAVLLENALIDSSQPLSFSIPKNLQSQGDPHAYIVQARGPIGNAFRALLAAAGAEIVSYIPNNAYLVRISAGGASGLAANPLTQAVVPYEPYYKIQSSLLAFADKPMPGVSALNLGLFNDDAPATIQQIEKLGGQILAQDRSPFGPVVRVQPPQNWTALAALTGVQRVEAYHPRRLANDLSRAAVGVASDTQVSSNYLFLDGQGVIVEVNDSGIDATHPDLNNRVFGEPLTDTDGHGTHVAGIIAGDGTESITVTNAPGSILPAVAGQFRGKAPKANLLAMDLFLSDRELQEAAAQTNALISNNSWNYGSSTYDLAAASYDAAVRDALPEVMGSQPVLFVFSAGNSGGGNDSTGAGGNADSILSPATAKNVITVGALEELRNITNSVTNADGTMSAPWQDETATSYLVPGFSSRGNVGIGIEGTYGRYKPDVVAPGTFVISTRSAQWDINTYFYQNPTNYDEQTYYGLTVQPGGLWANVFPTVPNNAVQVDIYLGPYAPSFYSFFPLPIYFGLVSSPAYDHMTTNSVTIPPDGGLTIADILNSETFYGFNYAVSNNTFEAVIFDLTTVIVMTNGLGNYNLVWSNLDQSIGTPNPNSTGPGPYYRYESGTSMSAASVSGVLALMQQFFTNSFAIAPSPALLKALLINGARATAFYNFQAQNSINYEGWGLVNLPNSLPPGITNQSRVPCASFFLDQSPTNALATGDSHTYSVALDPNSGALGLPLRITLVWTDPPGDPSAAIKLVNDLNLVVTNLDLGVVYYGNDIPASSTYNTAESPTNPAPNYDAINNVENVYLPAGAGTNFTVTIQGYRVNVNAVTAHPNNVVQDYALVIACGEGEAPNAFTVTDVGPGLGFVSNPTGDQQITYVTTNNMPWENQLVGANTPLLGTNTIPAGTSSFGFASNAIITLGMTNQWHFYVVSNNTAYTNAAFITFEPPTLSIPRMGVYESSVDNATRPEADIDLYVASGPNAGGLTNLDPAVVSSCVNGTQVGASAGAPPAFYGASLGRGGTEYVVDTNSALGQVYFVGVKSEDQMASEYIFLPVFSQAPFSQMNTNGSQSVFGVPVLMNIPDGSPARPGHGYVVGLALYPMLVQRVVVTNIIWHQNFGDLIGTLTLNGNATFDVLNNHDLLGNPPGPYTLVYDDSGRNDILGSRPSDGPGSLNNFMGQPGNGVWLLTETDDSLTQTGSVQSFSLLVEPHVPMEKGINIYLQPGAWYYDYVDVPANATNLTILVTNFTNPALPVWVFLRYGALPTTNQFDEMMIVPGGPPPTRNSLSVGLLDSPPLQPGRYYVGFYDPNALGTSAQDIYAIAIVGLSTAPVPMSGYTNSTPAPILDDAVSYSSISVPDTEPIVSVNVGIVVNHPRISDLVFYLISPEGTRILLMENRGGTSTNGAGAVYYTTSSSGVQTNYAYLTFTEDTNLTTTPIKFAPPPFVPSTSTNVVFADSFATATPGDYTNGQTFGTNWTVITNQVSVVNDPANDYDGDGNFLALANGVISNNLPTVAGQTYTLSFAYRGPGIVGWWRAENNTSDSSGYNNNGAFVNGGGYTIGEVGSAFSLLGPENYVGVPASSSLNVGLGPGLTIEGWINPSVLNTERSFVVWDTPTDYGVHFNVSTAPGSPPGGGSYGTGPGCLYANIRDTSDNNHWLATAANLVQAGIYQHVAVTYDENSKQAVIYYNGAPQVPVIYTGFGGSFTPQTSTNLTIGWRLTDGPNPSQWAGLDETSIYNRALSASEIQAIYNDSINGNPQGGNGKFDPAVFATSPALSLAEAGISLNGGTPTVINGNNTNWQIYTVTFTAPQNGTPLQITGLEPGMLLDDFILTEQPGNLYYQPEQSLDTLNGQSPSGVWQLEIQDDRVGAGLTNTLVSWDLNFILQRAASRLTLPAIPTQTAYVTNLLTVTNTATDTDTNLTITYWFLSAPTGANIDANGIITWMPQSPGQYTITTVAADNGAPPNYATNAFVVNVYEVNQPPYWLTNPPDQTIQQMSTLIVTNTATDPNIPTCTLTYTLLVTTTNASLVAPTNATIDLNGIITWTPTETNGAGVYLFTTVVANYNPWALTNQQLSATNAFTVTVVALTNLLAGQPQTNQVPPGSVYYFAVEVPTNADFATNILLAASAPVNLLFDQTLPSPSAPFILLTNSTGGIGVPILCATSAPPLFPGSTYYLGVQNTNSFAVNFAVEVDFHYPPPPASVISNFSITATNLGGTNGFMLRWDGPTNYQYEIQWTFSLMPIAWSTVLNPFINVVITPTNGLFSFFDDGTLTGGPAATKFYRILALPGLGPITGSGSTTNTVLAGSMLQAVVAVSDNAIWASNVLVSASGPLNVYFNQTNPPIGNTNAGDFLMLPATNSGAFLLTSNSAPPLVPGTNYYLGFQNPNTNDVTLTFQVVFGYAPTNAVLIAGVTLLTNGSFQLQWTAPAYYQFQVEWATNLVPPVSWVTNAGFITSTNGQFTFTDTNGLVSMKFYRLLEYP